MAAEAMIKSLPKELPAPTMADILLSDHRETMVLLKHHAHVAKTNDAQLLEELTDAISLVIRLHSEGEYKTLYPFMERQMGKRESHVDQCLQEHDKIEQEVVEAIKLRKEGGDKLSNAVDAVFNNFEAHMRHEEDQYVVALLNKVSESDLADVAISFMKAKEEAPLDPQPLSA